MSKTNRRCEEILDLLRDVYFPSLTRLDSFTLCKRNGLILSCLTLDEDRSRSSFQLVRHFDFLVSDADSISLYLAYRATNRKGRIPRVINFSSQLTLESIQEKFEVDIDNFAILMKNELSLEEALLEFDTYFNDDDRCTAPYQAQLYFDWIVILSQSMNHMDFSKVLDSYGSKLKSWPEMAFRRWGSFDDWEKRVATTIKDQPQIDTLVSDSLKNLEAEDINDFGLSVPNQDGTSLLVRDEALRLLSLNRH